MTTYISSEDVKDGTLDDRLNRFALRVSSVEGQLYSLGSTVTELRKAIEQLQDEMNEMRRRKYGRR